MSIAGRIAARVKRARVRATFRHLAGPQRFDLAPDEAAVILVVQNGAYHLPLFLDWHRKRGFRHFVIVDNGSTDATRDIAVAQPDTILAATDADFATSEPDIRFFASTLYVRGGWSLIADADELFDWPGDADLPALLAGLNASGATGVVAQMLDMFPESFAAMPDSLGYAESVARMTWCDLGDISRHAYDDPAIPFSWFMQQNTVTNPDIPFLFGGIRKAVFGENPCLTKHPLIRNDAGIIPGEHPHVSRPLVCADFTCLLRHYKFAGDYIARDRARAARGNFATDEYATRAAHFDTSGMTEFRRPSSFAYAGPDDLVRRGFLTARP